GCAWVPLVGCAADEACDVAVVIVDWEGDAFAEAIDNRSVFGLDAKTSGHDLVIGESVFAQMVDEIGPFLRCIASDGSTGHECTEFAAFEVVAGTSPILGLHILLVVQLGGLLHLRVSFGWKPLRGLLWLGCSVLEMLCRKFLLLCTLQVLGGTFLVFGRVDVLVEGAVEDLPAGFHDAVGRRDDGGGVLVGPAGDVAECVVAGVEAV